MGARKRKPYLQLLLAFSLYSLSACAPAPAQNSDNQSESALSQGHSNIRESCAKFRENMQPILNWVPTTLGRNGPNWRYPVGRLGEESRESLRIDLVTTFPPLATYADYNEEAQRRWGVGYFNDAGVSLALLEYGLKGTGLDFEPSKSEIVKIQLDDDANSAISDLMLVGIGWNKKGIFLDDSERSLCSQDDLLLSQDNPEHSSRETWLVWNGAQDKLLEMADVHHQIRLCQVVGEVIGDDCSEEDQ